MGNTYIFNKPGTYTYYEFKKQNVEKDEELIKKLIINGSREDG